ncbi:MAG TPA: PEPxxWA-CTERM sorting domain-containing protein [Sphingomonas sp.]|nr:PEPxxWA-CTERM sorting domain-containing protein [Sphingomonas sp.]HEU4969415.1 PEPxxWA-CTERM sorting domain-containing protein [Sphingomonas sp.]
MKTSVKTALVLATALAWAGPAGAAITVHDDPVLYWNDLAVKTFGGNPLTQSRAVAMVNTAMYDAVNRAYNGAGNYYNQGVTAPGGNVRAAASMAAHDVLVAVDPTHASTYDAALASSLALVGAGTAKTNGQATGAAYAAAMLANRQNDGATAVVPYTPGTAPGQWRPTPTGNLPAAAPQWADVKPFLMTSNDQFRAGPPPALTSAQYTAAFNEVKAIGASNSLTRTQDQTDSALFWDISNGMTWIRIGVDVIADDHLTTLNNARVLAKLSTAIADSFISVWDTKYEYSFWRPITAIREAATDGNDDTEADASWSPLFGTPNHPSYSSAHSIQSGAAAAVLLGLVSDQAFCNTIGTDMRCFTGLAQAAQDAADSRLWGGIHWRFDNEAGLAAGGDIGRFALAQDAFNGVPEPASWALMIAGFGLAGAAMRRRALRVAFV